MQREEVGTIVTGGEYETHFTGLRYRVIGLCTDWPSKQEKVVHVGLNGWDRGNLYCCSTMHFALNFKQVSRAEVMPVPQSVEKMADNRIMGSGV